MDPEDVISGTLRVSVNVSRSGAGVASGNDEESFLEGVAFDLTREG